MSETVLVVEDEADLMLTFRVILQTAGYEFIGASTGEGALSILEELVPDAMVLDLGLPGIDGWQVLATIRRAKLLRDTPIVITSACAEVEQSSRAAEFDCVEMLTKPFSGEELRCVLRRMLTTNGGAASPAMKRLYRMPETRSEGSRRTVGDHPIALGSMGT